MHIEVLPEAFLKASSRFRKQIKMLKIQKAEN